MLKKPFCGFMLEGSFGHIEKRENLGKERLKGVGVYCSKFDCSTINWSTLLAGNQLLDTKCINCLNPVNPGSTRFEQWTLLSSVCMTSVADLVMRGWNRPNPKLVPKVLSGIWGGHSRESIYSDKRLVVIGNGRQEKVPRDPYIVMKI